MTQLAILLLRQRARRLQRQYGWPTALSLGALLLLVFWKLASVASRVLALGTLEHALAWAWLSWLVMGVVTGRDLTWHVRIERLFLFRVPFVRLYVLDAVLGFVSYPILVLAAGAVLFRAGSMIAFCSAVLLTRAHVSIVRTLLLRGRAFGSVARMAMLAGAAILPASLFVSMPATAMLPFAALAFLLGDCALQRRVLLSGLLGPAPQRALLGRLQEWLLLAGPSRPSVLWRVTMLGWLRNRNALLLFIWGTAYGFLYTWFTRATGLPYFISFVWMVLIFHSYLRGNLFGIDQKGVWFYFLLPVPLKQVLRAKSASITVLQCVMVSAVLMPALLRVTTGMTTTFAWACVLGFAVSALLVSDIAGQFFSVLHPDPIERGSLHAGGMTLGAFVIPIIHVVLAVLYLVIAVWPFVIGLPLLLAIIRWVALPVWIQQLLRRDREEILSQMSAVTP